MIDLTSAKHLVGIVDANSQDIQVRGIPPFAKSAKDGAPGVRFAYKSKVKGGGQSVRPTLLSSSILACGFE
jgi:hypothetical protein